MARARERSVAVAVAVVVAVVHVGACAAGGPEGAASAAAAPNAAPVTLDVDLGLLPDDAGRVGGVSTRYCARAGAMPRRLVPENRRALAHLVSAVDDAGKALAVDGTGVKTGDLVGCARLVVDIGALADTVADKDLALRAGDDLIVTPDLWLWRPEPFDDARLFVRPPRPLPLAPSPEAGEGDEGPRMGSALLPWTEVAADGRLVVDGATYALKSDAVFGSFDIETVDAGGARFHVARMADGRAPSSLTSWLKASADAVAGVLGRYPVASANVVVVPVRASRPIVVAFYSRGGGPTVTLFVGDERASVDPNDLDATGRWALTHELAHALLPPVHVADAWLNEGLATWHQEVLARRAGLIPSDAAFWRELLLGLDAGRDRAAVDGLSLAAASSQMHDTGAYQHAYWGGAAVMLVAEVEARKRGASLDDLARSLRTAVPRDDRARSADALLALATDERGALVARAVKDAFAAVKDKPFPDVEALLADLGVRAGDGGKVTLDDRAPLSAIRRSITAGSSLRSQR